MTSYPDGTSRQSGYDKLDLASVTDRLGHATYYTHDADRNLIAVESAGGRITYLGYDGNGNLTSLSDPNGNTTYWDYNANSQPVLGEFLFMQRLAYERVHCNVIAMNSCRDLRAEVEDCRQAPLVYLHLTIDGPVLGCSIA